MVVCLVFILANQQQSFASHAMAIDISYECLGGGEYAFEVDFYRDCDGISAPSDLTLNFNSSVCGNSFTHTLPKIDSQSAIEKSQVCPERLDSTTCGSGSILGTEVHTYRDTLTMPAQCPDWKISWSTCCRNDAIDNLKDPNSDMYFEVMLNNENGICNTSPDYSSSPVPYICAGEKFCFNHGITEPDGDSLYYELVNPLGGANDTLAYDSSDGPPYYSPTYPVHTTDSNFYFNNETGQMCFTPDSPQTVIISMKTYEYKDDTLVGTSIREMQVFVDSCTNTAPDTSDALYNVSGATKTAPTTVATCPGDSVSFQIEAQDPNGDNVTMTTNLSSALPEATFDTTCHCDPVVGTFGWRPTALDTGSNYFTVKLEDDGCPVLGTQYYTYEVKVRRETHAFGDTTYCSVGDSVQLHAVGGSSFSWSPTTGLSDPNIKDPKAAPSSTTTYEITSNLSNACQNKDSVTVKVVSDINVDAGPADTICYPDTVQLNGSVSPSNQSPFVYQWSPAGSLSDTAVEDPQAYPDTTTTYNFTVTSDSGCTATDQTTVTISGSIPIVQTTSNEKKVCQGDTTQLHATTYKYFDNFDDGLNSFWADTAGVASNTGCGSMSGDALHFEGDNNRYAATKAFDASTCLSIDFCMKAGDGSDPCEDTESGEDMVLEYSTDGGTTWDTIQVFDESSHKSWGCINVSIPAAAQTTSTKFRWVQHDHTGSGYDHWSIDDVAISCSNTGLSYNWTPGTTLNDSTLADPIATINEPTTYEVKVADTSGAQKCVATSTISIGIDSSTLVTAVQDTMLCTGDSTRMKADVTGTPPLKCNSCGTNSTTCSKAKNDYDIWSGTSSTGIESPYDGYYEDSRVQLLFRASELDSAGMNCGTITALALNVASKASSQAYKNFTIKMQCTSMSTVPSSGFVSSGFTTVYGPKDYSTTTGWNTHTLDNTFDWNGTSNILIEICYDNNSSTDDDYVYYTSTSFNSVVYDYGDGYNGCSMNPSPIDDNERPNVRFTHCEAPGSSFSYSWSPTSFVDSPNIAKPLAYKSSDDYDTLNVTVSGGECTVSDQAILENCPLLALDDVRFRARPQREVVDLTWTVAKEKEGVKHYKVQRRTGQNEFTNIGQVRAKSSAGSVRYKFVDREPDRGMNFYRLKRVRYQEKPMYSVVRQVNFNAGVFNAQIYPNPVQEQLRVNMIVVKERKVQLNLYNTVGEIIRQDQIIPRQGNMSYLMDLHSLSSGVYFLELIYNEGQERTYHKFYKK